jgi:hypothetical protein
MAFLHIEKKPLERIEEDSPNSACAEFCLICCTMRIVWLHDQHLFAWLFYWPLHPSKSHLSVFAWSGVLLAQGQTNPEGWFVFHLSLFATRCRWHSLDFHGRLKFAPKRVGTENKTPPTTRNKKGTDPRTLIYELGCPSVPRWSFIWTNSTHLSFVIAVERERQYRASLTRRLAKKGSCYGQYDIALNASKTFELKMSWRV